MLTLAGKFGNSIISANAKCKELCLKSAILSNSHFF